MNTLTTLFVVAIFAACALASSIVIFQGEIFTVGPGVTISARTMGGPAR